MNKKQQTTVTICGQKLAVAVNLRTLYNFEQITGESVFKTDFTTFRDRVALVFSAVLGANPDAPLTIDELMDVDDWEQFVAAFNIVMPLVGRFFEKPDVVKQSEETEAAQAAAAGETPQDDAAKNASAPTTTT